MDRPNVKTVLIPPSSGQFVAISNSGQEMFAETYRFKAGLLQKYNTGTDLWDCAVRHEQFFALFPDEFIFIVKS